MLLLGGSDAVTTRDREVACSCSDHERQVPLHRVVACSCSDHERQVPLWPAHAVTTRDRSHCGLLMQ